MGDAEALYVARLAEDFGARFDLALAHAVVGTLDGANPRKVLARAAKRLLHRRDGVLEWAPILRAGSPFVRAMLLRLDVAGTRLRRTMPFVRFGAFDFLRAMDHASNFGILMAEHRALTRRRTGGPSGERTSLERDL